MHDVKNNQQKQGQQAGMNTNHHNNIFNKITLYEEELNIDHETNQKRNRSQGNQEREQIRSRQNQQ